MATPDEIRVQNRESWERSAAPWGRAADRFERIASPVTQWLLDAADLQPGRRVLELACGPGQTGLAAAARVQPAGEVLLSDVAEPMVDIARERADRAGVTNVSFAVLDAEWIDRPTASFDVVLCRWGLMFPADPGAAFRECRRVLRPGGRLALAAWDRAEHNVWGMVVQGELLEQGLVDPPPGGDQPGPFRFAEPGRLEGLLDDAGFLDPTVEPLAFSAVFDDFEDFWALHSELSNAIRSALELTDERGRQALRDGLEHRLDHYRIDGGRIEIPYKALMAVAEA